MVSCSSSSADSDPAFSPSEAVDVGTLLGRRPTAARVAEFLATLPMRAYGACFQESLNDTEMPWVHHSFLSRDIPVYEQLFNAEKLLGKQDMFFVGVPLNIEQADGI